MEHDFLYIDILGFSNMVKEHSPKIPQIFDIFNGLSVHNHYAFQTIVFSDTIIVFYGNNEDNDMPNHYYVTYLLEFAQQLFYRLLSIGVYYRGFITYGDFEFHELSNIQAYWGNALIEAYEDDNKKDENDRIKGFGLFVRRDLSDDIIILDKMPVGEKYNFIFLCQSYLNLYKKVNGILPVDINLLTETDEFDRIDEELMFFREITFLKENHPFETIREKYQTVYDWYKSKTPKFFEIFEQQGFLPFVLNPGFTGSINPFEIRAERELINCKTRQ